MQPTKQAGTTSNNRGEQPNRQTIYIIQFNRSTRTKEQRPELGFLPETDQRGQ
jgi:hypothetical protein